MSGLSSPLRARGTVPSYASEGGVQEEFKRKFGRVCGGRSARRG